MVSRLTAVSAEHVLAGCPALTSTLPRTTLPDGAGTAGDDLARGVPGQMRGRVKSSSSSITQLLMVGLGALRGQR